MKVTCMSCNWVPSLKQWTFSFWSLPDQAVTIAGALNIVVSDYKVYVVGTVYEFKIG